MPDSPAKPKRTPWNLIFHPEPWIVESGGLAIALVLAVVAMSGAEAVFVQIHTTNRALSPDLLRDPDFLLLSSLDILVPLTVALLSKKVFQAYLIAQCYLSAILLHYTIFFYNTLTLSTIYHSLQGAASLGIDIFGFARWEIILALGLLLALKLFLTQIAMGPRARMPRAFRFRGLVAVAAMTAVSLLVVNIYGKTGLSLLWVDPKGHRPAAERRLEEGTRESVRTIGYLATWLGEFFSGTYSDTTLIYAESRCADPDGGACLTTDQAGPERTWLNLPLPPLGEKVVLVQAESLDFAVLDMKVNGRTVTPFLNHLAGQSLVLRVFAPHKVNSCNSDYEILNSRIAEQNVVYYTYIRNFPDSVIRLLRERGYEASVFHGLGGMLFNLRPAYTAMGFNRFHFKDDLLAEEYPPSDLIMDHMRDEDVFDSAAKHLLAEPGPNLQFIVTMSSHVPFLPAAPEYESAGGRFARYVTSMNHLDRTLAKYYQSLPEGTTLVIWGDHGSDVDYPRGFPPGTRHVPFLVHVKGRESWITDFKKNRSGADDRRPGLDREPSPADDDREHSLCGLSHYLRCLFKY